METEKKGLSYKQIFLFWLPLASTWLMMALEGPFLAAVIARLAEPKYNLAAYGVAFSLAILVESPIIMLISASIALVKNYAHYKKLFRFALLLNGAITLGMGVLAIPAVFCFIAETLIQLPKEVSSLTYYAVIFLIPWPAAIGFRRFYQGILIYHHQTNRVAWGTVVRLGAMSVAAVALVTWRNLPGAHVAALSLSAGVCAEAIAIRCMAERVLKSLKAGQSTEAFPVLTYNKIIHFYTPLAITSLLSFGSHPIVTFFVGQSSMALESLAVLPVIGSFLFLFRSFGISYQEIVIAKTGERFENYLSLRNFGIALGIVLSLLIGIIIFTPLNRIWYHTISGLTNELTVFALAPTMILVFTPFLEVWLSLQRGMLVNAHKTTPITAGTVVELCAIILVMYIGAHLCSLIGAIAASAALLTGKIAANVYLMRPGSKVLKYAAPKRYNDQTR